MPDVCDCQCHGQSALNQVCSIEGGCGHLHVERRCINGHRCVRRERQEGSRSRYLGALLTEETGFCPACVTRLSYNIRNLQVDIVELSLLMGAGGSGGDDLVSGTRELPVPIRLGVEALRSEIDFELDYWAEIVAAQRNIEWDTSGMRLAVRVQKAAEFVAHCIDQLLDLGPQERSRWTIDGEPARDFWGDREMETLTGMDGAQRLGQLHHRVRLVAGRTKLVHQLTPACPWCDQNTLIRHNGSEHVECENCRKMIEEKHYNWFVAVLVREEKRRQAEAA